MHSGTKIHHSFLFFIISFRLQRIGKQMKVVQPIPIKLHRKISGFVKHKCNHILMLHIAYISYLRTDIYLMNRSIILFYHYLHRTAHIKLYHRSILYPIHIHLHIIFKQVFPFSPRHTDTDCIIIIMRHTCFQSFGISHQLSLCNRTTHHKTKG